MTEIKTVTLKPEIRENLDPKADTFQTVTAKAHAHKDVKGKTLYYIELENEEGETHFVSVGEKTANALTLMQVRTPKQSLPKTEK